MSKCEACGFSWDEHGGMNATCPPLHTPGPWVWSEQGGRIVSRHRGAALVIARLAFDAPEAVANGHLMASSPNLYRALKAVVSVADRKTVEFDLAHAAIAEAEGRVPHDALSGFPLIVTCACGSKTGFTEGQAYRFECRDCGALNEGNVSAQETHD